MRDHDLALAIGFALAAAVAIPVYAHDLVLVEDGAGGFTTEKPTELVLPSVQIRSQSEALAGSSRFARATVEISIESQSDDDNSNTHSLRVQAVADRMADQAALVAGCAVKSRVQLLGKVCAVETSPDVEQRAFLTVLSYRIGYQGIV